MFYTVLRIAVIAACCTLSGVRAMHLLQLGRYQTPELRRELRRYRDVVLWWDVPVAVGAAALNWYMPVLLSMFIPQTAMRESLCNWLMLPLFIGASALVYFRKRYASPKKPFNLSQRMVRLLIVVLALNLLGAVFLYLLTISPYIMFAASDYVVLLAAVLTKPLEDRINIRYYHSARRELLKHKGLVRIAVTGSYGKTETVILLKTLLSEKYNVLATPPSFSSAMGAARMINERLTDEHEVFIAELGAQKKGEIREAARIICPKYGVLTCVGPAHLDSFGSLEAVAQAKYELIQCLPKSGAAFFGSDGGFGDRLYALCPSEKYRASLGGERESYMRAENVETNVRGTRFELVCADGERAWIQTRLLGEFAVRDIALAAAVARKLDISMEEIRRGAEKLKPIRGHLQLIPGEITCIDDSRNDLYAGAAEALRVLSEFPGRRIVVTMGLVEAGQNADANYQFGLQIATCADYAVLIGPEESRQVLRGINQGAHLPGSSIRVVRDPADAAGLVREIAEAGDTVLYEGIRPREDDEE